VGALLAMLCLALGWITPVAIAEASSHGTQAPAASAGAASQGAAEGTQAHPRLGDSAAPAAPHRFETIHFRGQEVKAPAHWPVYNLAEHPRMCVRLDRKAIYLGTPGANQDCPANAMGRRRAILIDSATEPSRSGAGHGATHAQAGHSQRPATASRTGGLTQISSTGDFTGLGFDACTAPSSRTMSAWGSSPYRAIGVYIGGLNRGCSQPNLTASWVSTQISAGWHLIPTYVGLQAPTSSCGSCAKLSSSAATSQGSAAATDAVSQAQAVGIAPGSPIYFDMESYTRGTSATNATLTFLAAWTTGLHAAGYESGIYSSSASGIVDIAAKWGTGYASPDHLWIANWNGQQNTSDPNVSADAWSEHQRIHQYRGGHDETYGGVTINIDNNYVEGGTAGTISSEDEPMGRLDLAGSPAPGQVRVVGWAFDKTAPTSPVSIRAYVGGKLGQPEAQPYEVGPAVLPRADIAASHTTAGGNHGFDLSFPVAKSRRQRVCVYVVNPTSGVNKPLGCRTVGIAVPLSISHLKSGHRGLRLRIACEWPEGALCPGQILLRGHARIHVIRKRHGRRVVVTRVVKSVFARRGFQLTGGRSHAFLVGLTSRGRQLIAGRDAVKAQLVVALPGGRITHAVTLRP
jgi:hypothetical protein